MSLYDAEHNLSLLRMCMLIDRESCACVSWVPCCHYTDLLAESTTDVGHFGSRDWSQLTFLLSWRGDRVTLNPFRRAAPCRYLGVAMDRMPRLMGKLGKEHGGLTNIGPITIGPPLRERRASGRVQPGQILLSNIGKRRAGARLTALRHHPIRRGEGSGAVRWNDLPHDDLGVGQMSPSASVQIFADPFYFYDEACRDGCCDLGDFDAERGTLSANDWVAVSIGGLAGELGSLTSRLQYTVTEELSSVGPSVVEREIVVEWLRPLTPLPVNSCP